MNHHIHRTICMLALAAAVGCSSKNNGDTGSTIPSVSGPSSSTSQQAANASQSFGMLLDASIQGVIEGSSGGRTAASLDGDPHQLRIVAGSTRTVDLATLQVNGVAVFQPPLSASGTITMTNDGVSANSWPSGTSTLYSGTVSVALANVVIDTGNGDSLKIPSGTFTYSLEATATVTDASNWTVVLDASAAVDPALDATLTRGGATYSLGLSGKRLVHQEITRVKDQTNGVNTRKTVRSISGPVAAADLGRNAAAGATYSAWTVSVGGIPVVWNRSAQTTTTWNFNGAATTAPTVSVERDSVYLSIGGVRFGPYTTTEAAAAVRAVFDQNWL